MRLKKIIEDTFRRSERMNRNGNKSLRRVIGAGAAALAATGALPGQADAAVAPKAAGETKVVAMITHDQYHNGVATELGIRNVFASKKDWRLITARTTKVFTPELISDADLLIVAAASIPEAIDISSDPLTDTVVPGGKLWTDENVKAVIDNVRTRGMGFISLHATVYSRNRAIMDLCGVEPVMHKEVQPLWVHSLNQAHPITKDIGKFLIGLDEQFGAIIKSEYTDTLFQTTAVHDKRDAVGGWSLETGKGRVVGLVPGHLPVAYSIPEYREILWRAAHWAMKRDIPAFPVG